MHNSERIKQKPHPLFYGFYHAVILSILLAILIGFTIHFSSLSESHLKTFSTAIIAVSVFWGGMKSAQNAESRSLFHGIGVGLLFLLTTLIITFLIAEPFVAKSILNRLLYCIGGGAIGGIVGASFK